MLDLGELKVNENDIITERTAIIGQSGSGKSVLVAVICEELIKNGIGFFIIDCEGEYHGLKEAGDVVVVGKDIGYDMVDMKKLIKNAVEFNFPVIFDTSELDNEFDIVNNICEILYKVEKNKYGVQ